jgi:prepilin-type N-terminal cleavage/methylation domain-containing protein
MKPVERRPSPRREGFTLLEVMMVLVILVVMAGLEPARQRM